MFGQLNLINSESLAAVRRLESDRNKEEDNQIDSSAINPKFIDRVPVLPKIKQVFGNLDLIFSKKERKKGIVTKKIKKVRSMSVN